MQTLPVFVYDELMDPDVISALFGCRPESSRALLKGWGLFCDKDGIAFIQQKEGSAVEGSLLHLTQEQVWLLDQWRDPCSCIREKITTVSEGSEYDAWVYNRRNGPLYSLITAFKVDSSRKAYLLNEIGVFRKQAAVSSYPASDLYIFLPCNIDRSIPYSSGKAVPPIAGRYLEQLDLISKYEFNSRLTQNIERTFLDQVEIICETDDFEGKSELGRQRANIFITWHTNTKIAVVTLAVPAISVSITHLLDQMARGEILICDSSAANGRQKITGWLESRYFLTLVGTPRAYVNLSTRPQTEMEMLYLLATEAIGNKVYSKITGENFKAAASQNVAQYEYSDIYVAETCVVQIFKEFSDTYEMRLVRQLLTLFSIELILFQDAAISRVNHRVAAELDRQEQFSNRDAFRIIEDLNLEFAKTIVFWDIRNFRYETTQSVADSIARAFKIQELMDTYRSNQDFLEHLITIHSARVSEHENRRLNGLLVFLAVCQVAPVFYGIMLSIITHELNLSNIIAAVSSASSFVVILLFYRILQNRRGRKILGGRRH